MGLTEREKIKPSYTKRYALGYGILLSVNFLIWLFPWFCGLSGIKQLAPVARLEQLPIPLWVWATALGLFCLAILLEARVSLMRKHLGGCGNSHETVFMLKKGPYVWMRHPGHLAEVTYFCMLPVLVNHWIPFTMTALVYMGTMTATYWMMFRHEDRFNLEKWGDSYHQYMKEVPAINFIQGWLKSGR